MVQIVELCANPGPALKWADALEKIQELAEIGASEETPEDSPSPGLSEDSPGELQRQYTPGGLSVSSPTVGFSRQTSTGDSSRGSTSSRITAPFETEMARQTSGGSSRSTSSRAADNEMSRLSDILAPDTDELTGLSKYSAGMMFQ